MIGWKMRKILDLDFLFDLFEYKIEAILNLNLQRNWVNLWNYVCDKQNIYQK